MVEGKKRPWNAMLWQQSTALVLANAPRGL